jgi:hypothetical protein
MPGLLRTAERTVPAAGHPVALPSPASRLGPSPLGLMLRTLSLPPSVSADVPVAVVVSAFRLPFVKVEVEIARQSPAQVYVQATPAVQQMPPSAIPQEYMQQVLIPLSSIYQYINSTSLRDADVSISLLFPLIRSPRCLLCTSRRSRPLFSDRRPHSRPSIPSNRTLHNVLLPVLNVHIKEL